MKKFTIYHFTFLIAFFTVALVACNNSTDDKIYSSVIGGYKKKEVKLSENDLQFLLKAYTLGLLKINLSNEAQIRSTSAESTQLGKSVSDFHSNLNNKIGEIASEHGFSLPMDLTDDQKLIWKELIKEKGWNFDKRFSDLMEHIKAEETALYFEATKNISDKDIRLLALKSQHEFQLHQSLNETLCQKIQEKTTVSVAEEDTKNDESVKKRRSDSKS